MADREHRFAGRHVIAELVSVEPGLLDDEEFLRRALGDALAAAGATVCAMSSHRFQPQGVTVLALLTESHASVHTYPEFGAAFVDAFTCGSTADPERAVRLLVRALDASVGQLRTLRRGTRQVPALADPVS
ncbi:S-adenosylmethionine decarboxylase [Saccharopolyspora erythraea NRRL 2338]|uniref:S-adenosylmethionine decarboxylase proenzyme n=2 Tax=Saccharopolyspora erythraea TaxID=1836 RepID=A4FHS9_SACEN|nr:adenosylmethionine decarboxylase [Saccharopolyspora erythraea]EQD82229.1 S-adenosylmethionine decarboxylase [Saccharopolyspora erythraea D]PFG97291.1 S-adenosylmethionine decarboxylase [Saccharopolyspora erythraea NRRL 2338]QRK87483.1 adenosylmethionine decarboxylase [Saccharopolyspora erythraea]CAM03604.1 S-adenosylmethionine decarboxylase proenzyme [Saccharopolyspora erythraea NRRL 2338]